MINEWLKRNINDAGNYTIPKFVEYGFGQVEPNHLSAQRTSQVYAQLPAKADIDVLQQGQFVKYDYLNEVVDFDGAGEWMLVFNEIKLYREGQRDCEFAMIKDNYNARIYSPFDGNDTVKQALNYKKDGTYTIIPPTYAYTNATEYAENTEYFDATTHEAVEIADATAFGEYDGTLATRAVEDAGVAYDYERTTLGDDFYEPTYNEDPFHFIGRYHEKKMPVGTKMVPRVFKTNVGDIFTTNTIDEETLEGGEILMPRTTDGILVKDSSTDADTECGMKWQVVKVYTMPDGQKGVKIMRIA